MLEQLPMEDGHRRYRCLDVAMKEQVTLAHADIWRKALPLTRLQIKNIIRDTTERQRISNGYADKS